MKAAIVRGNDVRLEQVPRPEAGPGEVVLRVVYCGICGSDVHRFMAGGFPDGAILGHEVYGTVAEVGENVQGWQVGQRAVIIAYDPCRECRWCLQGEYQLCVNKYWLGLGANPGGFAQYIKARSTMLLRVPEGVTDRAAALAEPLAVALHAVRRADVGLGDTAVVVGAGPVGLLVVQCLKVAGAKEVGVVEIAAGRAELAGHLGADHLFFPGAGELAGEVTRALGAQPDVVFDCAGAVSTLQVAADLVRPHGKVMLVGVSMKPVLIIAIEWGRKEAEMRACIAYRDEFPLALDLLAKGKIDVESLISDVAPLEDVGQYLRRLLEPDDQVKVLVQLP